MKRIAIFILMLLSTQLVKANFVEGQQATVVANSGLKMRTAPQHGHVLKVIPYGEEIMIINSTSADLISERIDWVSGKWIEVSHEGIVGYVFDGFVSPLELPLYETEVVAEDNDFIFPLVNWSDNHLQLTSTDTSTIGAAQKVTHHFKNAKLIKTTGDNYYKIDIQLEDVRIMDVYHLVLSMLEKKESQKSLMDHSIFIEKNNELSEIRINHVDPIVIKVLENGRVSLRVSMMQNGC